MTTENKSAFDKFREKIEARHGEKESTFNWGLVLGWVIYIAAVLVATAYSQTLVDLVLGGTRYAGTAQAGAYVISFNAVSIPIALKVWCFETKHRKAAMVFYAIDFVIITLNTLAAANGIRGTQIGWLDAYMQYFAPASFVFTMAGWGYLFLTDPDQRVEFKRRQDQIEADMLMQGAQNEHDLAVVFTEMAKLSNEADQMLGSVEIPPWMALGVNQTTPYGQQQQAPTRTPAAPQGAGFFDGLPSWLADQKEKRQARASKAKNGTGPKGSAS